MARVALVCEGDAENPDKAFSGIAKSLLDHLRRSGHKIIAVDAGLSKIARAATAMKSFSTNRGRWRGRFRYGPAGYQARSRSARLAFAPISDQVDMVLQIGATFVPPTNGRMPYALFCDWTMALSIKDKKNRHSSVHFMSADEAEWVNERQTEIYRGAAIVFAICDKLRGAFIDNYGLDAGRVVTAYPGPNMDLIGFPARPAFLSSSWPTLLFIGKEFQRKGGEILLAAFAMIRSEFPKARLLIIGPKTLQVNQAGVENLGLLRKSITSENLRLDRAYQEADVFCLPSFHDPFPTVVREAMYFRLPCVTTDIWALPEMVVDGETGYTVPIGDASALADRIIRLLRDPEKARAMGEAGRRRAERLFNWEQTARLMHECIQQVADAGIRS